ncbi:MAG: dihydroxyacetone kinase subunit DhaL [Candidatus Ventricola sp.]
MLTRISEQILTQTEHLCQLDSFIGDGDHGITVERGFKAVLQTLAQPAGETPAQVLKATGDALVNAMGGAIGPILGSFFKGGCKKLADVQEMDAAEFETMLASGLRQIKLIGEAKEGDRTLVDALSPACDAFTAARAEGCPLKQCMARAADAAEKGAQETRNMVARKGRARFLGEKSRGYVDAGATTMSLIIRGMSDYMNAMA